MRPRILAVRADRGERRSLPDRDRRGHGSPAHMSVEQMRGREQAKGLTVVWVDARRLLEEALRNNFFLPGDSPIMRQRSHNQMPRLHAFGRLALGTKVFRGIELRFDGGDNGLGDFILYREHVGEAAVVMLRPDLNPGSDIVELRGDPHPVSLLADASFDDVADAQFLSHLLRVHSLSLEAKG